MAFAIRHGVDLGTVYLIRQWIGPDGPRLAGSPQQIAARRRQLGREQDSKLAARWGVPYCLVRAWRIVEGVPTLRESRRQAAAALPSLLRRGGRRSSSPDLRIIAARTGLPLAHVRAAARAAGLGPPTRSRRRRMADPREANAARQVLLREGWREPAVCAVVGTRDRRGQPPAPALPRSCPRPIRDRGRLVRHSEAAIVRWLRACAAMAPAPTRRAAGRAAGLTASELTRLLATGRVSWGPSPAMLAAEAARVLRASGWPAERVARALGVSRQRVYQLVHAAGAVHHARR